jgi:DNA gyrase/topoisomerase IV subunit B
MSEKNKEIVVLSEKEHVRMRSHVYVGPTKPTEEKVPLIKDKKLTIETVNISVGMYKIFNEIVDNSLDEAKRMNGKMKKISIHIDSKKNTVKVIDTGNGFYKGASINKASNRSNIETAVSMLRSGSNFNNDETQESLIGNNGLGSALCNCLSDEFSIITINDTHYYQQKWIDFEREDPIVRKKQEEDSKGTTIEFKPLKSIFGNSKWDKDILTSSLILKYNLIKRDTVINKLKVEFYWDDTEIDLDVTFLPENSFKIDTEIGQINIWEKYEGSGSVSFVNSANCTGIHQKIVNDFINIKLDDSLGHHFYDSLIVLNLPPKYVKFGDQNKTRFVTTREEIETLLLNKFGAKLQSFFKTDLFERIQKKVEERKNEGYIRKLRNEKKKVNIKTSHKYFPAQKSLAENLFIVEGLCIEENEKINVWRNGEFLNLPIKDVFIGDEIITHKNRIKTVVNKQKKLKECVTIKLKDGTFLKQPKTHKYYVFNKESKEFIFKCVSEIDKEKDCLVRSNLGNFIGTIEVNEVNKIDNPEYPNIIFLEDGSFYQFSDDHKYCVYNETRKEFTMKPGKYIIKGELLCLFDHI